MGRESFELFEVECREGFESFVTVFGELQSNDPMIGVVTSAAHQSRDVGPADQFNCAVVTQQEVVGDFANGRPPWVAVAPYGEEQLVLSRSEASDVRLLLAPSLETT